MAKVIEAKDLRGKRTAARIGMRMSDDAKEKMRQAKLGKSLTSEHKENISKALKAYCKRRKNDSTNN